ncbi:MAG: Oligopeptide transport system permease protein OppC [Candidatus Binatus sp.]|nr:Oligopeptide transport system permease protein OppC [Candidatus Binatus sp.]
MNAEVLPAPLQSAAAPRLRATGLAREWRLASRTVRFSALCLILFYLLAAASPFFASYDPTFQNRAMPDCPPMRLHVSAPSEWQHGFLWTHPMVMSNASERKYTENPDQRYYVHLFSRGHLFTTDSETTPYYLLGSDALGRDLYSRIVYGSRVSMCVGLIGVLISFSLGISIGALSGYVGGLTDNLIMRWSEIEMSLPSFYFLLALAAVIPAGMSTVMTFFMIVAIMSFISWAGFARIIRGMASSVRSRPYVEAARALGASRWRIITRHIIPSVLGYAVVAATLSIPGFILGESALSLLGLGIQEPASSWGNLLSQALDVQNLAKYPWILIPGIFIFLAVMSFNFLGDHLRDRLDPSSAG